MLTRKDIARLLTSGVRTEFQKGVSSIVNVYPQITTEIPSTKAEEVYAWLGSNPRLREWKDERRGKALLEKGFTLKNKDWEATISVDRNAMDDDQYGQVKIRANTLGASAKKGYDEELATVIQAGETELCYDGQYYFDTDHSEGSSGSQSNYSASGLALSVANAKTVITTMMAYKDDQGGIVGINPTHIMVPPALEFTAREIFDPQGTGDTNANTSLKGRLKIIVNVFLTETTAWYVMDLNQPLKPFIFQNRKPLTLDTDDTDLFKKKVIDFGVDARFAFGYGDWRQCYKAVA